MNRLKIIAFNHSGTGLDSLASFYVEEQDQMGKVANLKLVMGLEEIFFIATCNRVEFVFVNGENLNEEYMTRFLQAFYTGWDREKINWAVSQALAFDGKYAMQHLLKVASSLDSLVVGEREIAAQIRKSYENSQKMGFTGDFLRIVMNNTIRTAKEVFTDTLISEKPVSVVSLAYRTLKNMNVPLDGRFLIIGSGQTNSLMAKYLYKHGYRNFTIFNRTLENAKALGEELKAQVLPLNSLFGYDKDFEVIISCTGSAEAVITKEIYTSLKGTASEKKIIVDLALPNDVEAGLEKEFEMKLIRIEDLKSIAAENLLERKKELEAAEDIIERNLQSFYQTHRIRQVELAMSEVPKKIREIRETAVNSVFAEDLSKLDESSREVLEKVLSYMEKKYISVPMVLAKDILIGAGK